jgi:hypothetical protein
MQQLETKPKKSRRNTASRIAFIEHGAEEWDAAWQGMAALTGDTDFEACDLMSGEVWQYMGSTERDGAWCHEFRHRWHPRLKQRWLVRVPASRGWFPGSERLH